MRITNRDEQLFRFLLDQKFAPLDAIYFRFFDRRKHQLDRDHTRLIFSKREALEEKDWEILKLNALNAELKKGVIGLPPAIDAGTESKTENEINVPTESGIFGSETL